MTGAEHIICAAVWVEDGKMHVHQPRNVPRGLVFAGWRHPACIELATAAGFGRISQTHQGFLTSLNRYVTRREAAQIAYMAGQIENWNDKKELYSEDLY